MVKQKKLILGVVVMWLPTSLLAANYSVEYTPTNTVIIPTFEALPLLDRPDEPLLTPTQADVSDTALAENLLKKPALLQRTMEVALIHKSVSKIKAVLPIYQRFPKADAILIHYAKAIISHSERDLHSAIVAYRKVLTKVPHLHAVRYAMASALYQDKQFDNAKNEFKKLRSVSLSNPTNKIVDNAILAIDRKTDWQFFVNTYLRREKNINNAPKIDGVRGPAGTFIFDKPEKATGVHLDVGASKRFNLRQNVYSAMRFDMSTDYFWDNKKYNDLTLQAAVALGYEDNRLKAEVAPFVKRRLFSNNGYSKTLGAKTLLRYQLTPKLSASNMNVFSYEDFDDRTHLNGRRLSTHFSLVYKQDPSQYLLAGAGFLSNEAKELDDSFTNQSFFISWSKKWSTGLSSQLSASITKKEFKGHDFFFILRKDKSYNASLSLSHQDIHWHSLVPKVIFSLEKTKSNHFYYDDRKNYNINVSLSRFF